MPGLKTVAIETVHGVLYGRDALIVTSNVMTLAPFEFLVRASLARSCCIPRISGQPDIGVEFRFRDISSLMVFRLDDYPFERFSSSSFDEVANDDPSAAKTYVLSTYDHVFQVTGLCDITFES